MKRYHWAETATERVEDWVPADVAQGLYEALLEATSELQAMKEQVGYRAMTLDVIRDARAALAAADGEEA